MKKKYIIALEDRNVWSCGFPVKTLLLSDVSIFGSDLASVNTGIELTPYTEPDLEQVRKEAYDKGYHEGHNACFENAKDLMEEKKNEAYQHGLADAWEAARKIAHCFLWGSYQKETGRSSACAQDVLEHYSASEAIEKIRQYEQEQEEIKVGDEVDWNGDRYVVTYIDVDETYVDVIDCSCGSVCDRLAIKGITKTGRHFPEIAAVLEKMRGEKDVPETY